MLIYNNIKFDDYTKNKNHIENGLNEFWTQICQKCVDRHSINENLK